MESKPEGAGGQQVELKAGTHVELVNAKLSGGIKFNHGAVILLGVVCDANDFHGDLADIEKLGDKDFRATIILEGRIVREVVPSKGDVLDGQTQIPFTDDADGGSAPS